LSTFFLLYFAATAGYLSNNYFSSATIEQLREKLASVVLSLAAAKTRMPVQLANNLERSVSESMGSMVSALTQRAFTLNSVESVAFRTCPPELQANQQLARKLANELEISVPKHTGAGSGAGQSKGLIVLIFFFMYFRATAGHLVNLLFPF
jgi:hypothetical protein